MLYPYIAGVTLLMAVTVWIYMRGYHDCQSKAALAVIKEENAHAKIEQKVNAVPDSKLDHALSRWVLKQK